MYNVFGVNSNLFVGTSLINGELLVSIPYSRFESDMVGILDRRTASDLVVFLSQLVASESGTACLEDELKLSDFVKSARFAIDKNGHLVMGQHRRRSYACGLKISGVQRVDGFLTVRLDLSDIKVLISALHYQFDLSVVRCGPSVLIEIDSSNEFTLRKEGSHGVTYTEMPDLVDTLDKAVKFAEFLGYSGVGFIKAAGDELLSYSEAKVFFEVV